jgi:hypothetical protein
MSELPPTNPPVQGRTLRRVIIQDGSTIPQPAPPAPTLEKRGKRNLLWTGIVGAVLVGLAVVITLLVGNNGGAGTPSKVGPELKLATPAADLQPSTQPGNTPSVDPKDLPGTAIPFEGSDHVGPGQPITYTNYPPTSGRHYPGTAELGFSYKEIAEGYLVHSMEHGAIVLYYRPDLPESVKESIRKLFTQIPPDKDGLVKLIAAPYPKLRTPMALAAWMRLLPLSEFDFEQILTFYRAWVSKGPEG